MLNMIYKNIASIFSKPQAKPTEDTDKPYIKYHHVDGKLGLSCYCPPGQEKGFSELWLLATSKKTSENILSTVKLATSSESYAKIQEAVNQLNQIVQELKQVLGDSEKAKDTPIIRPSEVFGAMENAARARGRTG